MYVRPLIRRGIGSAAGLEDGWEEEAKQGRREARTRVPTPYSSSP
jgi:hypothetical protein